MTFYAGSPELNATMCDLSLVWTSALNQNQHQRTLLILEENAYVTSLLDKFQTPQQDMLQLLWDS